LLSSLGADTLESLLPEDIENDHPQEAQFGKGEDPRRRPTPLAMPGRHAGPARRRSRSNSRRRRQLIAERQGLDRICSIIAAMHRPKSRTRRPAELTRKHQSLTRSLRSAG
jgi:hypothetical protein